MMEMLSQLEKENGGFFHLPAKGSQAPYALNCKGSQRLGNAKGFASKNQGVRKALGDVSVNQYVRPRKPISAKVKKCDDLVRTEKRYPEIETLIPYNPLDYEAFDVPEEHKLSDHCLAGVPLFISMGSRERFDVLADLVLSPVQELPINYDTCNETFTLAIEDISVDLPPMCYF